MPPSTGPDLRPFRLFVRSPATGLLTGDGLLYRGERAARREARKITRVWGLETLVRPQ
ncbi:hypothetical protein [Actinomadura rupiterrae]|uniref:hypothetical protein n=1 Tax=Actinomadura rupiterrae TaxID=559627 RepID=UPI0020A26BB1|nr:hypothetical protein [Actinomadura rupiterrae]MCP2341143.1 hypothetical protein [Actinomadura rupiterrae]